MSLIQVIIMRSCITIRPLSSNKLYNIDNIWISFDKRNHITEKIKNTKDLNTGTGFNEKYNSNACAAKGGSFIPDDESLAHLIAAIAGGIEAPVQFILQVHVVSKYIHEILW